MVYLHQNTNTTLVASDGEYAEINATIENMAVTFEFIPLSEDEFLDRIIPFLD